MRLEKFHIKSWVVSVLFMRYGTAKSKWVRQASSVVKIQPLIFYIGEEFSAFSLRCFRSGNTLTWYCFIWSFIHRNTTLTEPSAIRRAGSQGHSFTNVFVSPKFSKLCRCHHNLSLGLFFCSCSTQLWHERKVHASQNHLLNKNWQSVMHICTLPLFTRYPIIKM